MEKKYDAFISYRHNPKDSEIAAHIQRKLERFIIPKSVNSRYGIKKINRVFRDKEELPLTSSLSETIMQALNQSDSLIVICSKETKKSRWVTREIDFFLRTHSRKKVFAVVVDGEPDEVMPDILLNEEKNTDGKVTVIKHEPLACDYRMPVKDADKKELPRLIAGMIGCDYEELVGRIQKYKRQRLAIILSVVIAVVLAFGAYLLYSLNRFRQAYLDSLRNESVMLAVSAEEQLMDGNRVGAINLALQALPVENPDRPVVPEAVYALSNAVYAYIPDYSDTGVVWNYSAGERISEFILSPNGTSIAAVTDTNAVPVWDISSHELLFEIPSNIRRISQVMYAGDDTVIISYERGSIQAYDVLSGTLLWESGDYYIDYFDAFISIYDDNHILVASFGGSYGVMADMIIDKIDIRTGVAERFLELPESEFDFYRGRKISLSPDKTKFAFICYLPDSVDYSLFFYDISNQSFSGDILLDTYATDYIWADNNSFVVSVNDIIYCFDSTAGEISWYTEFIYNGNAVGSGFVPFEERNAIGYYCGSSYREYDVLTGEETAAYDTVSPVVYFEKNADGIGDIITWDGQLSTLDDEGCFIFRGMFPNGFIEADSTGDSYFILEEESDKIIEYGSVGDNNYIELSGDTNCSGKSGGYESYGKYSAYVSYFSDPALSVKLINTEINEVETLFEFPVDSVVTDVNLIKMDDNYIYVAYKRTDIFSLTMNIYVLKIDYIDESHPYEIICAGESIGYSCNNDYLSMIYGLAGKSVFWGNVIANEGYFANVVEGFGLEGLYPANPIYISCANAVYFKAGDKDDPLYECQDMFYLADEKQIIVPELPDAWTGEVAFCESLQLGLFVISDGRNIAVFDSSLNLLYEVDAGGRNVYKMEFSPDSSKLLILYSGGMLGCYDTTSFEEISLSNVFEYSGINFNSSSYECDFIFDEDDSLLMIQIEGQLQVIDMTSMKPIATVWAALGYNPETNRFYSSRNDGSHSYNIICYDRYELADLINMAHDYLGDEN